MSTYQGIIVIVAFTLSQVGQSSQPLRARKGVRPPCLSGCLPGSQSWLLCLLPLCLLHMWWWHHLCWHQSKQNRCGSYHSSSIHKLAWGEPGSLCESFLGSSTPSLLVLGTGLVQHGILHPIHQEGWSSLFPMPSNHLGLTSFLLRPSSSHHSASS